MNLRHGQINTFYKILVENIKKQSRTASKYTVKSRIMARSSMPRVTLSDCISSTCDHACNIQDHPPLGRLVQLEPLGKAVITAHTITQSDYTQHIFIAHLLKYNGRRSSIAFTVMLCFTEGDPFVSQMNPHHLSTPKHKFLKARFATASRSTNCICKFLHTPKRLIVKVNLLTRHRRSADHCFRHLQNESCC